MSGCGNSIWYPDSSKDKDKNFIEAMKVHGYDCRVVAKVADCTCDCEYSRTLLITNYRKGKKDKGKDPWTDPTFKWGWNEVTDLHAISKDYHDPDWQQIPHKEDGEQEFDENIPWGIFKGGNLLCCCQKDGEPYVDGSSKDKIFKDGKVIDKPN